MFDDWWSVFLVALIFTGAISYFLKEPDAILQSDLQKIGSKLDSLSKEIAEIKKAIEE